MLPSCTGGEQHPGGKLSTEVRDNFLGGQFPGGGEQPRRAEMLAGGGPWTRAAFRPGSLQTALTEYSTAQPHRWLPLAHRSGRREFQSDPHTTGRLGIEHTDETAQESQMGAAVRPCGIVGWLRRQPVGRGVTSGHKNIGESIAS